MPHVTFITFSGFRVHEQKLLELGMTLPGLQQRAAAIGELPALGLLTLAGMLPQNWSCSYHSPQQWSEELVEEIIREKPTLVALSALTASIEEAYAFSQRLQLENIPTVMGGLHITACPEEARQFCDAIVIGEGEAAWTDLLRDAESGNLNPQYHSNQTSPKHCRPLPRFDLLKNPARLTLQTQRGCPLACDFCGASRLLGKFHQKPVENIRRELSITQNLFPGKMIELADDNTFVGRQNVREFFDVFEEFNVRYFTEADWRIGERPDILEGLARSGCVQVLMGIESLVFRYPGMGAKATELNRILDAVEAIQESGVAVNGCFILGADGETPDSIDRLVQFILESPFAEVQITLQTPFPGTELYQRLKREQRLLPERGWPYYTLFDVTYQPDQMSVTELEQAFTDVLARVYSKQASAKRNTIRHDVWRKNRSLHRGRTSAKEAS